MTAERVPYDPGLPRDVETETDPYELATGLMTMAESIREFFKEPPGDKGWILALFDDGRCRMLLSQLAFGGAILARLSMVIDDAAQQHSDDVDAFAQLHAEIAEEIRQHGDASSGVRAVVARVPEPADVGQEGART